MSIRWLLAVDIHCSAPAIHAVQAVGKLSQHSTQEIEIVLLTVIPVVKQTLLAGTPSFLGDYESVAAPRLLEDLLNAQHTQAEQALDVACSVLEACRVPAARIKRVVRLGWPADEIAHIARKEGVQRIIIGHHRATFYHNIRRWFAGSLSLYLQALAPCPVTSIALPADVMTQTHRYTEV
jgi:nucleotide-binding universal stress UspA family protein